MAFDPKEAEKLLARCHRRCCVCHRFCGSKMELDHMQPKGEGGPDDIANAIPLCFECHAEVHAYNDKHPRGRKFQPSELKLHKEQWLSYCDTNPAALAMLQVDVGVGPLQALKRLSMVRHKTPFLSGGGCVNRVVHVPPVLARSS